MYNGAYFILTIQKINALKTLLIIKYHFAHSNLEFIKFMYYFGHLDIIKILNYKKILLL